MLCRLCVYECLSENAISLESEEMCKLIAKHLRLEITQCNALHFNVMCDDCLHHLEDFDEFFRKIEKRQEFFNNLIETKVEVTSHDQPEIEKPVAQTSSFDKEDAFINCGSYIDEPMANLNFTYATCGENELKKENPDTDDQEDEMLLSEIKAQNPLLAKQKDKKKIGKAKIKLNTIPQKRLRKSTIMEKTNTKNQNNNTKSKSNYIENLTNKIRSLEEDKRRDELVAKYVSFECELCAEKLENYRQFQTHFQKSHKRKAFITCCGKRLSKRIQIIDHMEMHKNPEYFKCKECNKTLKSRVSFSHHQKLFHRPADLDCTCSICGKFFAYPSLLKAHKAVHNSIQSYPCKICDKNFKTEFSLKCHVKNIHGERDSHVCDICGKEYRFKLSFEQHVAEHQGALVGKRQQCPICKVYVSINYLKRHLQRHETVDVECDICGKKFTSIIVLQSHKKTSHNKNQQSFECSFCDRTFPRKRSLKEHTDMHTGKKEYSCQYCPREFRSRANMYAHSKKMHHELWAQAQQERYKNPEETRSDRKHENAEKTITSS